MAQKDWKSVNDGTRFDSTSRLVVAPSCDQGVRDALRGAFACAKDTPDEFDRLLARLR